MPGPIKADPTPPARAASSLIQREVDEAQDLTLPDPGPYQSHRPLTYRVAGETITVDETYWTARQLRRWLAACPKGRVTVEADRSYDPAEGKPPPMFPVYYDGFLFEVPRRESVLVPLPIAQLIWEAQSPLRTLQAQGINDLVISARSPNGMALDGPDDD